MRVLNGNKKQLVASAYSGGIFFLTLGPMIGIVLVSISFISEWDNLLQGLFAFVVFGYLFGAVPAVVAGIVFGLTYEIYLQKRNKPSKYMIVLISSITGGVVAETLFFLVIGKFSGVAALVAVICSVICSFLRFREIENARNELI